MILPLTRTVIKGVIWFQGESDSSIDGAEAYNCTFPAMIRAWRRAWHEGTGGITDPLFPFGFVQLGPVGCTCQPGHTGCVCPPAAVGTGFSLVRWSQTASVGHVPNAAMPNTFMAVAMDLPDEGSPWGTVHFRDKAVVGHRLALAALSSVYHVHVSGTGPIIAAVRPQATMNNARHTIVATVTFREDGPLPAPLRTSAGFQFGFADPVTSSVVWLNATAAMSSAGEVTLQLDYGANFSHPPVAVRYAWALSPCYTLRCALYSAQGLPTPPYVGLLQSADQNLADNSVQELLYPRGIDRNAQIPELFLRPPTKMPNSPLTRTTIPERSGWKVTRKQSTQPSLPPRYHLRQEFERLCPTPGNTTLWCPYFLTQDFDLTNHSANEYGTSPWGGINRKVINHTLNTFRYGESCSATEPITAGEGVPPFPPIDGFEPCGHDVVNGSDTDVFCRAADGTKVWWLSQSDPLTPLQYSAPALEQSGVRGGLIRIVDFRASVSPGVFVVPAVWCPACANPTV